MLNLCKKTTREYLESCCLMYKMSTKNAVHLKAVTTIVTSTTRSRTTKRTCGSYKLAKLSYKNVAMCM